MYLSGAISQALLAAPRPDLGLMLQPRMGQGGRGVYPPLESWAWAADNGCYAQGDRFDADAWLAWLERLRRYRDHCLFAVAPDVVGDAQATLRRSLPHLEAIRALGFKTGFVSQDGATSALIPWSEIDCLFVGGTTAWKLGEPSYALAAEARVRGKWTHQGRVNSLRRLRASALSGFDSADGTYLAFGPDVLLPRIHGWLDALASQPPLWRPSDQEAISVLLATGRVP